MPKKPSQARRNVLKSIVVGGGAAGAFNGLPTNWKKPIVASVALPAHAQMSPTTTGSLDNCSESLNSFSDVDFSYTYTLTVSGGSIYNAYYFSGTFDSGTFSGSGTNNTSDLCKDGEPSVVPYTISGTVGGDASHQFSRYCGDVLVSSGGGTSSVLGGDGTYTLAVTGYGSYCPDLFMYT